jgi:mRNA interferase RelE/StbE
MYEVLLHPDAQKAYIKADKALAKKIARCLEHLEQNPRTHPNIKALKGDYSGYYRYRIGDYRVIYSINDKLVQVLLWRSLIVVKHMNHDIFFAIALPRPPKRGINPKLSGINSLRIATNNR